MKKLLLKIYKESTFLERIFARYNLGFKLKKDISKKPKIGLAVLVWERPEYLEKCLDSLFQTKLYDYDITFLLNDDGSTDPKVKKILEKKRDRKYKVVVNYTPKGHGSWGAAFNKAIRKLNEIDNFDIIGTADSDALFNPEWLKQTIDMMIWCKANHKDHKLIKFSPFNSSNFEFHRVLGTYKSPFGNYVVKERMGDVVSFYFNEDLKKIGFYAEDKNDETLMTEKFKRWKIRNFSSETTYVEHIGHISVLNQWRPTPVTTAVHGMRLAKNKWPIDPWEYRYLEKSYYERFELDYTRYIYQENVFNNRNAFVRIINIISIQINLILGRILSYLYRKQNKLQIKTKEKVLREKMEFPSDFMSINSNQRSEVPLDIIIPAIEKDLATLPYVIEGLRKNLLHEISDIKIVSPAKPTLIEFCENNMCKFIDEDTVLPIKISDFKYIAGGLNRTGWLFQQLLKFAGKNISDKDYYLVIDADYIMSSPRAFIKNNRMIFDMSDEYHTPYHDTYIRLINEAPLSPISFVSHHMLFSQKILEELKEDIERINKKPWYEAIIEKSDRNNVSGFSEYETYGNYALARYFKDIKLEYWHNYDLLKEEASDPNQVNKLIQKLSKKYKSITISNPLIITVDKNA